MSNIETVTKVVAKLERMSAAGNAAVYSTLDVWGAETAAQIKVNLSTGAMGVVSRTGRLMRKVTSKAQRSSETVSSVALGVFEGSPYAASLEHGSVPHRIEALGRALRFTPEGAAQAIYRRFVDHPGTRAYHFIENTSRAELPKLMAKLEAIGVVMRDA